MKFQRKHGKVLMHMHVVPCPCAQPHHHQGLTVPLFCMQGRPKAASEPG